MADEPAVQYTAVSCGTMEKGQKIYYEDIVCHGFSDGLAVCGSGSSDV